MMEITFKNLGTVNKNCVCVKTDKNTFYLYFSYTTLVGIEYDFHRAVSINRWSTTTGKLLNELEPDKKKRVGQEEFDKEVKKMFGLINS